MKPGHTLQLALLLSLSLGSGGCVTRRLWEGDPLVQMREPAQPLQLELFTSKQTTDVLVCYDEGLEGSDQHKARVYWLNANQKPQKNPHRPKFASRTATNGLSAVLILSEIPTNGIPGDQLFAIVKTNPPGFTLYRGSQSPASYDLPVYADSFGKTAQVLLTPPAAVADLVIVGVVAGSIYALSFGPINCADYYYNH